MRKGGEIVRIPMDNKQQYARESNNIMRQIGSIKEAIHPLSSASKTGDPHKQKWYQYLPRDSHFTNNNASMRSKEEMSSDHYRQSLEKRLQKLFRQEKEMFKERQYLTSAFKGNEKANRQSTTNEKLNPSNTHLKMHFEPFSIDSMERKIKQLEQRYKMKENRQKSMQIKPAQTLAKVQQKNDKQKTVKSVQKETILIHQQRKKTELTSQLNHSVEECLNRQKHLETQVVQLRKQMNQLRQNNQEITQKMYSKEEKRKRKHRTREILQNILLKLQYINVQISNGKRKEAKSTEGGINKIENEARQIVIEFQKLKIDLKRLEQQRKKVQMRQNILQDKLKSISPASKHQPSSINN